MIGERLGAYQIERELGSGGMGKVYAATVAGRARGLSAGDRVALKVVHPHLLETEGFFMRFMQEAQIGSSIRHENVVRTYMADAIASGGVQHNFLVMEYVEGQDLRGLLKELETVPEELCRHVAREICKGLFCPSCQAKRAALSAEHVREEIALPVPHRHVTFTIPRALRGLFERDRRLLSILPRCAYEAIRRTYQAHFRRKDAVPGMIASIQTFGSFLNFHPHVHTQITEGVVTEDGTFLPLLAPDLDAVTELFRRLVLAALRKAERLSESFHERLLGWSPSGFSVHGEQIAHADEPGKLERLCRYIARAPFALGKMQLLPDGRVRVETPPAPRTGQTSLVLDVMEFIHRVTTQIPDPRRHLIRYYGAYSHRHRGARRAREEAASGAPQAASASDGDAQTPASPSRASWARLVRRIYEVDPLLCPRCSGPLSMVAVITEQKVVTAILRHLDKHGQPTSVHARDPPAA